MLLCEDGKQTLKKSMKIVGQKAARHSGGRRVSGVPVSNKVESGNLTRLPCDLIHTQS